MKNILIIIKKQCKDTLKNKTVLIQFLLFPLMTLVMENAISLSNMPELFFTKLFSIMYIGMAPLTATAAIISEEKEKNTLRVLMMANVRSWQYLTGVGLYVWVICMAGAGIMSTNMPANDVPFYLLIMGIGFIISIAAGACVGIYAKNQMIATSVVMPVMLVLSFAPMLAMFNEKIERVAAFFYTQQLKCTLDHMAFDALSTAGVWTVLINAVLIFAAFFILFHAKGLES